MLQYINGDDHETNELYTEFYGIYNMVFCVLDLVSMNSLYKDHVVNNNNMNIIHNEERRRRTAYLEQTRSFSVTSTERSRVLGID